MAKTSAEAKPARRGRPRKSDIVAPAPTIVGKIAAKKRGRPSKAAEAIEKSIIEPTATPKKRGRPAKKAVAEAEPRPEPKSRREDAAPAIPFKRAGRPIKTSTATSLNRVAGSPRVTKRTAPRRASVTKPPPRISPLMRSRLRTREPPKKEAAPIVEAPKRRGRKPAVEAPKRRGRKPAASVAPKKTTAALKTPKATTGRGRPRKHSAPVIKQSTATDKSKIAAVSQPSVPRKKRGYTTFVVPDKWAAQFQQLFLDLEAEVAVAQEGETQNESEEEAPINPAEEQVLDTSAIDEDVDEAAQQDLAVKFAEEDNASLSGGLSGGLDDATEDVEVDIEIRQVEVIREETQEESPEATDQELQIQGLIENELNGSGSEFTRDDFNQHNFEQSVNEVSLFPRELEGPASLLT
ncbi:hypothetical protein K504DRAFT_508595 [Pleomassaria siparia CBS 279.74]|uniref:Uncharacterized protein n=1 Tax=Pleomassaria siparia CBS 279.74 TaxID=1314801 RepID=A0A6G1JRJ4_9PLEO|nr:hypothetical protein K504DRAFT_508595 [Pleomassaria siparia CBS 279.74]